MPKTRIKVKLPAIVTRDEAEAVMTELAQRANNLRKIIAGRDAAVLRINEAFAADIGAAKKDIDDKTDIIRAWAEANPDQFPKGRKSLALANGTLGFRTGTPKLALLNRKWTWAKALLAVRTLLPAFIRDTPEIDKEALIAQRDEEAIQYGLSHAGLKITNDESFFIEPRLTDTDARASVPSRPV